MKDRTVGLLFVAVQALLLTVLVLLPNRGDWQTPEWIRFAGLLFMVIGIALIGLASLRLGASLSPTPVPVLRGQLTTTGLYAFMRHPIYSGVLIAVAGFTVRSGSWVTLAVALVTIVFFNRKASWEEARLGAKYESYSDYADKTPRFIPRLWRT